MCAGPGGGGEGEEELQSVGLGNSDMEPACAECLLRASLCAAGCTCLF